ncbi:MAG: SRPBCC domain-containing protein [Dehalococcoidia bacterium]
MTTASTTTIERELFIAAEPATVFSFLTEPGRITEWMGRLAVADPRPGGILRVDYNGFDIMRGQFLELVPVSRVVWSWGWESLSADAVPPGASRIEFQLDAEAGGTRLRVVHSNLPVEAVEPHAQGWDHFLGRLAACSTGVPVEAEAAALSAAESLASELNMVLIQTIEAIQACPAGRWTAAAPADGRQANVVADHIANHLALAGLVTAVARGESHPVADLGPETLEQLNAGHAADAASVTREAVVARIRQDGPAAVEAIRALDDAALRRTTPLAVAGGAILTAAQIAEGPLLADSREHLEAFRSAATG